VGTPLTGPLLSLTYTFLGGVELELVVSHLYPPCLFCQKFPQSCPIHCSVLVQSCHCPKYCLFRFFHGAVMVLLAPEFKPETQRACWRELEIEWARLLLPVWENPNGLTGDGYCGICLLFLFLEQWNHWSSWYFSCVQEVGDYNIYHKIFSWCPKALALFVAKYKIR
jgi:hypothetical protein